MDVGLFNGRMLYTGLRLDYRLKLLAWLLYVCIARYISAVAKLSSLFCDSNEVFLIFYYSGIIVCF